MPTYPIIPSILKRRSVRKFDSRPVEREKILACLEAARMAPSAENKQPWRFIVLDDPAVKKAFGEKVFSGIYRHTFWALGAPILVVLLAELDVVAHRIGKWIQGTPFYLIDMGIAGEHFVIQAQSLGLGTCWIGWFHAKKAGKFLKVSGKYRVCGVLAVGYPSKQLKPRPLRRKTLNEIAHWNVWNRPFMKSEGKNE